ncbi:hypothetical protein ACHAXA_000467 [Cyclostephanos tholiformis]|uniref:HSF-type DNA-binding domain-containing protein n=1 Tax=Cyclostephanos tholiformis TaxID=382380 RepID=A0ABD3RER4_9STRA
MLALESPSSSTRILRGNFMNALFQSPEVGSRPWAQPATSSQGTRLHSDGFSLEMSDLMLPASALESDLFGTSTECGATVVSTGSSGPSPVAADTPASSPRQQRKISDSSERRHSLPSTLMLPMGTRSEGVTQPVPEFLCHLFSMLRDPSYSDMISWYVPSHNEPDLMGGGIRGVGKIVVHKPEALQESVLGRYYRHSKYASFQRQLNYFGFKKRLHGGKKGKLSPCSYIHESLTDDVGSLLTLKRRPPAKKRASDDMDAVSVESVSSMEVSSTYHRKDSTLSNNCDLSTQKEIKKSKSDVRKRDKKHLKRTHKRHSVADVSTPLQVEAENYDLPRPQSVAAVESIQVQIITSSSQPPFQLQSKPLATPAMACQPTLLELLSTSLPPSDILFSDDVDSVDDNGIPAWVTDDGQFHYHNVDSSLIELAMLY